MPEYLAPGVYMEEVEIGARPVEGVSTSTAGFLGFAERGPLDLPTLVTGFAQFEAIFGGFLPAKKNGSDLNSIRWLAYAVSAFFENGGKRAYVTRVAAASAESAAGNLPKITGVTERKALSSEAEANEQALQWEGTALFSDDDLLMLEDGGQSEYLTFKGEALVFSLTFTPQMQAGYPAGTTLIRADSLTTATTSLSSDVQAGSIELPVADTTGISVGDKLLLKKTTYLENEVVDVADVNTTAKVIIVSKPLLLAHASATEVHVLVNPQETFLVRSISEGDQKIYTDNSIITASGACCIIIDDEFQEILSIAEATNVFQVSPPLKYPHEAGTALFTISDAAITVTASSVGSWGNDISVSVTPSSLSSTEVSKMQTDQYRLDLETVTGIEAGTILQLPESASQRFVKVVSTHKTETDTYVMVEPPASVSVGDIVFTCEFDVYVSDGKNEEVFKHLSYEPEHSRYFEKMITVTASRLILAEAYSGSTTVTAPSTEDGLGWFLGGGLDGFPAAENEIDGIYEGIDSTETAERTGLYTFKNIDEINIVAIPGITSKYLQQKLVNHCEVAMKDRFAVLDSIVRADLDTVRKQRNLFDTSFAALYYPWLYAYDLLSKEYINMPPSGYVCGVYARTDVDRGVHKAPANEKVNGVVNTERLNGKYRIIDKGTQDILNPLGVNCIRSFPGRGIRVWGARTMSSNSLWKYVNVRRLMLYIEESIEQGTQWVVFEPNDQKLWARVKQTVRQFLTSVWKSGALMGSTPEEAFFIDCGDSTMDQSDIDNGRLIIRIGVAPVKPAEFVIFRIAQWQGGSAATE